MSGSDPRRSPARSAIRATLAMLISAVLCLTALQPASAAEPVPSAASAASTSASVSGVVTDAEGAPLSGMLVYLMGANGTSYSYTASANTGADGAYRIDDVAPGTYSIQFFGDSAHVGEWWDDRIGQSDALTFEVAAGQHLTGMDAALSEGAAISGTVTDADGAPLADATVRVYGLWSGGWGWLKSTTTDAGGAYRFGMLRAGLHAIHVLPPAGTGLVDEWWEDSPFERTATRFEIARDEAVTGIDVELPRAAAITGMVTGADGAPLQGVAVHARSVDAPAWNSVTHYARTDESGVYVIEDLKAWRYDLTFTAPGTDYLTQRTDDFEVAAGAVVRRDASLIVGASIAGSVTGRNGVPLAWATVRLSDGNGSHLESTTTADDGTYRFNQLTGGRYSLHFDDYSNGQVRFDGSGYFAEWWEDAAERERRSFLDITTGQHLTGIDAQLTPESVITGTMRDADGAVLSGSITLYEVRNGEPRYVGYAPYRSEGRFILTDVRAGTYTLRFEASEHLTAWWGGGSDAATAGTFEVGTGEVLGGMDAQLSRGGSIAGTVSRPDGAPFEDAYVSIYSHGGAGWELVTSRWTGADGRYSAAGLAEGTYTVKFAKDASFRTEWWNDRPTADTAEPIVLSAGETATGIDASMEFMPTVLNDPTITGSPWIGHTLTASAWSTTSGATLSYEWLAGGEPIAGATQKAFMLDAAQSGKRITLRVTASAPGRPSTTKVSAPTDPVILPPVSSTTPTITGDAVTGATLTALPGNWAPGTTLSYRWFANGMPVTGGTEPKLVLSGAQAGTRITVVVTGAKPGYSTVAKTSAPTAEVAPAPTSGLSPAPVTEPKPVRG